MTMTSRRPYIIRSLYEWILDNDCTPYVLINAMADNVDVPQQYVKNGQIVLNISPAAVVGLQMSNDVMQFNGRFGGVPRDVYVPMGAVMGIYARETGEGMVFDLEEPQPPSPTSPDGASPTDKNGAKSPSPSAKNKPGLRVVK